MAKVDHDLTALEWSALQNAWGGCAYCGSQEGSLQKDCLLPISRGGRYTLTNVVPACGSCNASKCNTEVTTWMRRKKLDERAFLVRHAAFGRSVAEALGRIPQDEVPEPAAQTLKRNESGGFGRSSSATENGA